MADAAAHLGALVFPEVPVWQWVLTLPYTLRFRMAHNSKLAADIHRILRRGDIHSEIGDALNLNLHCHLFAIDGVYSLDEKGKIHFQPVALPTDKEVAKVAERIALRIEADDPPWHDR